MFPVSRYSLLLIGVSGFLVFPAVGRAALLLLPFESQLDQPRNQVLTDACGLPELGVHADLCKAGHGVYLVQIDAALASGSIRKSTRARPERSQARKAATAIARICRVCAGQFGRDHRNRAFGEVLGLVVVELLSGNDFADHAGLGRVVAENGHLQFASFGLFPLPPTPCSTISLRS